MATIKFLVPAALKERAQIKALKAKTSLSDVLRGLLEGWVREE